MPRLISDIPAFESRCTKEYDHLTPKQAWHTLKRGDHLLWMAAKSGVERVHLVRAACACARLVLHLATPGDDRPRLAIEAAEAWCDHPSEDNQRAARAALGAAEAAWADAALVAARAAVEEAWGAAEAARAAWGAAEAAVRAARAAVMAARAAWRAARAAVRAADAAFGAADAALGAADAAFGAADAALGAAIEAAVVEEVMHARCADAVRSAIPWSEVAGALVIQGVRL